MLRTLKQCQLTLEFLASLKKEVKWHGRSENEAAHYCNDCEVSMCETRINSARLLRSTLISSWFLNVSDHTLLFPGGSI